MARHTFRSLARPVQITGAMMLIAAVYLLSLATPSSGAVSGTATPDTNLHDQDSTHVHATGLPARTGINVLECAQGATSSADCEGQTINTDGQSNAAGVVDVDYKVWTLPNPAFVGTSITCDDTHPCVLYVGTDQSDFSGAPKTLIAISFAAGTGTTTTSTSTTSTTLAPTTTSSTSTTTSGGATSTTSASGFTTTTVSSGTTTSTAATSSQTANSTSGTTTTLGPFGTGFGATVVQPPSDAGGSASGGSASGATPAGAPSAAAAERAADRAADRASDPADPSDVHLQSASDPATLPATGLPRLAPWLAVLGLLALFSGSVARRMILRDPRAR